MEPGCTHDLAAARATGFLGALHAATALLGLPALADQGYDGAGAGVLTPTKGHGLHPDSLTRNQLIGCLRAQGERAVALLKTRWTALNRIHLCPQRIGAIAKAALVLTTAERPIRWRVGSWKRSAAPATDAEKNNPAGKPRGTHGSTTYRRSTPPRQLPTLHLVPRSSEVSTHAAAAIAPMRSGWR